MQAKIKRGHWVRIPFGRRITHGIVVRIGSFAENLDSDIQWKDIIDFVDDEPVLSDELLDLVHWVSRYYGCMFVQALRAVLPGGLRRGEWRAREQWVYRLKENVLNVDLPARAVRQQAVISYLSKNGDWCTAEELIRNGGSRDALQTLVLRGIVERERRRVWRKPFHGPAANYERWPELNEHQRRVMAEIHTRLKSDPTPRVGRNFLLYGVTGSGKTEIYLRLIAEQLARDKQAIMLVPEIALTPQVVDRFRARFGDRVAVLHSALSEGERADEWERIRRQEVSVVVGARSAVFAPLERIGVIIVDEEHETTYKQEETPRYHAREVAMERARRCGAFVVLGSATPSVKTYFAAEQGMLHCLRLPHRVGRKPLPDVEVVDMRNELATGNRTIFSRSLQEALRACLDRGEQAMLFLNRRGYSTFVLCRSCGRTVDCPHCSFSLTYHAGRGLRCHYCNHTRAAPELCPHCESAYIRYFGLGTQQLEEWTRKTFPSARVLRMDVDTTTRKGSHERIYRRFVRGEADILVGTQMITKGWDVAGVTVVGVIAADYSLRLPDPYSAERTFQLLTQVAGRAGRGERAGRVIVQTYQPEHYAVAAAAKHDYESFYAEEIERRRRRGFDPFRHAARWMFQGPRAEQVKRLAYEFLRRCRVEHADWKTAGAVEFWGPAPMSVYRLRDTYRYQLLAWSAQRNALLGLQQRMQPFLDEMSPKYEAHVTLDIDPVRLL